MTHPLGERIKALRELHGLTQAELVRLSELSPSFISSLEESDDPNPKASTLIKLAKALNTSVDFLLLGQDWSDVRIRRHNFIVRLEGLTKADQERIDMILNAFLRR